MWNLSFSAVSLSSLFGYRYISILGHFVSYTDAYELHIFKRDKSLVRFALLD